MERHVPVSITSQKSAQESRSRVNTCYICSGPLPVRGTHLWKTETIAEHVIPSSILKQSSQGGANYWPITLPVHSKCDEIHKSRMDELVFVLQTFLSNGIGVLSNKQRGLLQKRLSVSDSAGASNRSVRIDGDIRLAGLLWARGLITALYGDILPLAVEEFTRLPGRATFYDAQGFMISDRDENDLANATLGELDRERKKNNTDHVVLCDGAIQFHCVWSKLGLTADMPWACLWQIEIPAVEKWSMSTRGIYTPWFGLISTNKCPANACTVVLPRPSA